MPYQAKKYYVYILASKPYGVLYIGVTSNLLQRVDKHENRFYKGFTSKYKTLRLVYYEIYGEVRAAIQREKRLKKWKRQWKLELIIKTNPSWKDLYQQMHD